MAHMYKLVESGPGLHSHLFTQMAASETGENSCMGYHIWRLAMHVSFTSAQYL